MSVYLISDPHYGHENILTTRTIFSSIEEHDNQISENILKSCCKRDTLFILGDVCLNMNSFHHLEKISNQVENLYIVLGNHDLERSKSPKIYDYLKITKKIFGMKKYKKYAWLTHCPIHEAELYNKINIHGHVHEHTIMKNGGIDNRYVNVSCENTNYKPIEMTKILNGWRSCE